MFGSFARGAPLCGDLDLIVSFVHSDGPRPSERVIHNLSVGRTPGLDVAEVRLDRGELEKRGLTGLRSVRVQPSGKPRALAGFYWPGRADSEGVAVARLRAKEKKLSQYRDRRPDLHEFWLAIGPFGPGVMEDGGFSFLLDREYTTPFTRVFLVDPRVGGSVFEVSPRAK